MHWFRHRLSSERSFKPADGQLKTARQQTGHGRRLSAAAVALALGVAAAATSGAIAFAPFTGPDAALGGYYDASCLAATKAMNAEGGVLGHQLTCATFDTRGDPADAVPATNQMFATEPNLAMVIGCTSDEAASVVPIINSKKMVMFCMTGQSEFDHVHYPYFFRLVPPDLAESYAMVAIAKYDKHYKKIALAFGNDIGSQTFVHPAIAAIKKAGLKLSANVTLDLTASTFRTEAEEVVQSHRGAGIRGCDLPVRGQAAQRRQDDPRHWHLSHHRPVLVLVSGSGDWQVDPRQVLRRGQPGDGYLRTGVHPLRGRNAVGRVPGHQ